MKNLHLKIKSFIFALTLFLLHVEEAKGIAINAMPLTMPQHLMRHFYFMRHKPEIGEKHGMLTLVDIRSKHEKGKATYEFSCDCGNSKFIRLDSVRMGRTRSCGCVRIPDQSIRELCVKDYASGMSCENVALKNNTYRELVRDWVTKDGAARDRSQAGRDYDLDDFCFKNESNCAKYWAGFIAADGNVRGKGGGINITLQTSDIDHLYLFRDFAGSNSPVTKNKGRNTSCIRINSLIMVDDLKKYGIGPRKSFTYTVPEFLKNDIDFWRGMVDGDGWVNKYKSGQVVLGICGTLDTCENFKNFCLDIASSRASVLKNGNIFRYTITDNPAKEVMRVLYGNSPCVSLRRKYEKAMSLI